MISNSASNNISKEPPAQCKFFVVRKKRLCRMTVRSGRQYCGEHEPQPRTVDEEIDTRIPCPNDPKHTCYASKLEKHLAICNARSTDLPEYIIPNVNIPAVTDTFTRTTLNEVPRGQLAQVIDKVNSLYEKYVKHEITTLEELPIHHTVLEEFNDLSRTESSLRHLRQTSSLLHVMEREGLVQNDTCYVELGAGKGIVSYYLWQAWCSAESRSGALLLDRAALRHKRDNKLPARVARVRADLAHVALHRVPAVMECERVVGVAKHLCGVATDYALHCVTSPGVGQKTRGLAVATCCHHRCQPPVYLGRAQLQELGITDEEFNVILGIVSWATCGDGRPREKRAKADTGHEDKTNGKAKAEPGHEEKERRRTNKEGTNEVKADSGHEDDKTNRVVKAESGHENKTNGDVKAESGDNITNRLHLESSNDVGRLKSAGHDDKSNGDVENKDLEMRQQRALTGKRAKALLDWGRAAALRGKGFEVKLVVFVPDSVSPENLAIVAVKA